MVKGNENPSWKAWGAEGPLVRDLVSGNVQVPEPAGPPRGVKIGREEGGGFLLRIGTWPLSLQVRLARGNLGLKGIFRKKNIALASLADISETPMGLAFRYGQESFLFVLPDPEIRHWLKALILRNLVTVPGNGS